MACIPDKIWWEQQFIFVVFFWNYQCQSNYDKKYQNNASWEKFDRIPNDPQNLKITKTKESLRNGCEPEGPKETGQLNVLCYLDGIRKRQGTLMKY